MFSSTSKTPVVRPHQTLRGHTHWVTGVVCVDSGRHIITCSVDGSLPLWDLESGTQIGEDWRDKEDEPGVCGPWHCLQMTRQLQVDAMTGK